MKIKWLNVLHFYQPPFQDKDVVKTITEECYLPVTRILLERPNARCIININGCLLDMLYKKVPEGKEVLQNLSTLLKREQIQLTGTGKFHPVFPLISKPELHRQVTLQEESLEFYLGIQPKPEILFLPEMAYSPEQIPSFKEKNYTWIIIDESSLRGGKSKMGKYQLIERTQGCNLLVRDHEISEAFSHSIWRKSDIHASEDFIIQAEKQKGSDNFVVTATDVEVFGHHQKNRWNLLADVYDNSAVQSICMEEITTQYNHYEVDTIHSSWSTKKSDKDKNIFYPLWFHPQNRLHRLLWQLLDITVDETRARGDEVQNSQMDKLFSSCPFFWASCRPWWNGMIVEQAADSMINLLEAIKGSSPRVIKIAELIRNRIYEEIFSLNETGKAIQMQNDFLKTYNLNKEEVN